MKKICTFIGHSDTNISNDLLSSAKTTIVNIIENEGIQEFYCGGYGNFDKCMSLILRELKNIYNLKMYYITPYNNAMCENKLTHIKSLELYDDIIYPELENIPYKYCILKRNEWMIDQSDIIIAYVKYSYGGASKSLHYAMKKKKKLLT